MNIKFLFAILIGLALCGSASTQVNSRTQAPWESGNAFLANCDDTNPLWVGQGWGSNDKTVYLLACDWWVLGIRQGIEYFQQIRPLKTLSPAEKKAVESQLDTLKN